ncbi:BUB protein kinase [Plasmodiophora brassicae]|uniref:BUB protein kinase n=1 Tax=Plasmodiophora brassicae TaxID=37360 RepID=A0A0G4J175_PLABS|nr:hypothetical protein PBRA_001916 [Plasmodiophora brassicae]
MQYCEDIEPSKENIKPLPQGRGRAALTNASAGASAGHASAHPTALQFEQEIRAYNGPDPLSVWCRYIKWTEEAFVSGGDRSHLTVLLERCCMAFKDDPTYRESKKYLRLWITFAHNCHEGVEDLFQFLRSKSIGQGHALFYQAWAHVRETKGDYQGAEDILESGLNAGAHPVDKLTQERELLRSRRRAHEVNSGPTATSRDALSQLERKADVRSHRKGIAPQPLPSNAGTATCGSDAPAVNVFVDENNNPVDRNRLCPPGPGTMGLARSETNKENVLAPATWNAPLRRGPPAKPAVPSAEPSIQVFVDEALEQPKVGRPSSNDNLQQRAHGATIFERIQTDPLRRVHEAQIQPPAVVDTTSEYDRRYNVDMLRDPVTGAPDALSFEEVRARDMATREKALRQQQQQQQRQQQLQKPVQHQDSDEPPMTVNYSQMLSLQGPGLKTPKLPAVDSPASANPRRLQFMMTPGAITADVPSIQTFLAKPAEKKSTLIVRRDALPPPSPTATMTVDTRNALHDVRSMFVEGCGADDEAGSDDPACPVGNTNEGDEQFEIYHDPTTTLPVGSLPDSSGAAVIDPDSPSEVSRRAIDPSKVKIPGVIDHSSVGAPDEIRDIDEDCTIELDDADLLVMSKIRNNIYEAQDLSTDKSLVLKIVRPTSVWESHIAARLAERLSPTSLTSLTPALRSYAFEDLALVVSELRDDLGTVQALLDRHKSRGTVCPEPIALLYSQQILAILQILANANILHRAIQPRHLVLGDECHTISLIDFCRAIDLSVYSSDTRFQSSTYPVAGATWRNEIDSIGAASTIHQILFGSDLDLTPARAGDFQPILRQIERALPESYAFDIWGAIFQSLLTEPFPSPALHHMVETHWQDVGTDVLKYALCDTNVLMHQETQ